MREVKFRGYRLGYPKNDRFGWVYGGYFKHLPYTPSPMGLPPAEDKYEHLIISDEPSDWNMARGLDATQVDSKSVGQFTGLKDRDGKEIYEGDIVRTVPMILEDGKSMFGQVILEDGSWVIYQENTPNPYSVYLFSHSHTMQREVIGNIYESSELLEGK